MSRVAWLIGGVAVGAAATYAVIWYKKRAEEAEIRKNESVTPVPMPSLPKQDWDKSCLDAGTCVERPLGLAPYGIRVL